MLENLFKKITGKDFEEKRVKAHFFRTPREFRNLKDFPPSNFIIGLDDSSLFFHIAGAARDSFTALDDPERAGKFLEILKSDFWDSYVKSGKVDPREKVANAIAFIVKIDDVPLEGERPFLDFCKEKGIDVTDDLIKESMTKFKKPA